MKSFAYALACATLALASAADAAVVVTTTPATNPYTGPAPTYDFDNPPAAPVSGGAVVNDTISGQHLRPWGSTGNYLSVGPLDGSPAVLDLTAVDRVGSLSFLWGSIDQYNLLELLDAADNVLFSINGLELRDGANPQPPAIGDVNRIATFTFTDTATQSALSKVRFSSSRNAFEIDNILVRAVPEPATWLMMILGFLGVGFALRRSSPARAPRIRFS